MKEYCVIALDKLNSSQNKGNKNNNNNLIPIVVIDKHSNYLSHDLIFLIGFIPKKMFIAPAASSTAATSIGSVTAAVTKGMYQFQILV